MKTNKVLIIIVSMFFTQLVVASDDNYVIDESHFSLGFLVEHAGYAKTLGMFKKVSGSFSYDKDKNILSNVEIIISCFKSHYWKTFYIKKVRTF